MAYQPTTHLQVPRCDSYFVEDLVDEHYACQLTTKERSRLIANERQLLIADDLSRLAIHQYQGEILAYMEESEVRTLPDVASIDLQAEVQWFMRPYLLDFLIEAHAAFRLLPETLHLAVNLLDRYCSKRVVYKRHYQLVGCASLFIAAKYGDKKEKVPSVRELKSMCCSLYDDEMFIQMEWHVLQTLDWDVGAPTIDAFLQIALGEDRCDAELEHMAWFLCEIALFHKEFVSCLPSVLARSALALARCVLGRNAHNQSAWTATYDSLVVVNLSQLLRGPSQVLSHKYSSSQFSYVSNTLKEFLERQAAMVCNYAPPTPPCEVKPTMEQLYPGNTPHTPQKQRFQGVVPDGVLTPPITPEGEYFVNQNKTYVVPSQYPSTPTPESMQRTSHGYTLPPPQNYAMA